MTDSARDRAIEAVLVARCENVTEPDGTPCPGRLRYHWGQSDAACDTCGGRCGIAVANWERVEPDGLRALVTALADKLGVESSEISDQLDSSHRVDYDCGEMDAKAMIAARLRETLTQP